MSSLLFSPGAIVATAAAVSEMGAANIHPATLLHRHLAGDWGDVSEGDAEQNVQALASHDRIVSTYQITPTTRILIVTEADRSATTIMTPEDY